MSESEKKGSAWPWIAVPLAAVITFFLLRECQHRLPPSHSANSPATPAAAPATHDAPAPAEPSAEAPENSAPASEPAPQ